MADDREQVARGGGQGALERHEGEHKLNRRGHPRELVGKQHTHKHAQRSRGGHVAPDECADGKPRVRCLACLHCRHTVDCLPPHGPAFARSRRCLATATRKPNRPCAISTKSTPLRPPRSSPSKTPAKSATNPQTAEQAKYNPPPAPPAHEMTPPARATCWRKTEGVIHLTS